MRSEIFLLGIIFVICGPILTVFAFSSCLGTILSGNVFACVSDVAYIVIGGVFFVTGIIMALVGVIAPDPVPVQVYGAGATPGIASKPGEPVTCKKCGRVYNSSQFFCPACGQRPV